MSLDIVACDFETYWQVDYTLSKMSTEAYVRDARFETIGVSIKRGPTPARWYSDPIEVHAALHDIDWSKTALLAHNTYFDGAILGWHYDCYPKFYLDTMSMARPRHNMTTGCSLDALVKHYHLGLKGSDAIIFKGLRRAMFSPTQLVQYGQYCCNDTELTWQLFRRMREESEHEYRLIDQYIRLFVEPLLHLDAEVLAKHLEEVQLYKAGALTMAALELAMEPDDLKKTIVSNEKFAQLLIDQFGLMPPKKISATTGKPTWAFNKTDQEFVLLQEVAEEDSDTTLKTLLSARVDNKSSLEETRTVALLGVASRGTLPVYLGHYLAHTGRAGGGDKINLQNLPVRERRFEFPIRQAILAPPGHVCVSGDLSQIEARILAWLAGQQDVVDAFAAYDRGEGPDIYCVTASNIFGREITRADERERFVGKVVRLALGYGMAHKRFRRTAKLGGVVLSEAEAYTIVTRHRAMSPKIMSLWEQGKNALHAITMHQAGIIGKHGVVTVSGDGIHLPKWGRMIRYPDLTYHERDPDGGDGFRMFTYRNRRKLPRIYGAKVIENVVQALAGIILAEAWLRLAERGLTVALQVHDELVLVLHQSDVEYWLPVINEELTRVPDWAPGLPIACSIGYDERYGLAKS